ncbi:hypothetical protein CDAR_515631 [Caerostris darwini]|uniref:Uncharacterized protein n=1 Tax=Caerostris darwini TaxID=1538125 RepID=A0AAV4S4G5_9ARAC|nr:hypothetical protein CDAR_515631 [Caerostris darwini]
MLARRRFNPNSGAKNLLSENGAYNPSSKNEACGTLKFRSNGTEGLSTLCDGVPPPSPLPSPNDTQIPVVHLTNGHVTPVCHPYPCLLLNGGQKPRGERKKHPCKKIYLDS